MQNNCTHVPPTIPPPKHPAGNCPNDMYYADDYGHQPNQNNDAIKEYHGNIQNHYHQEQTHDQPNNLPTHEPMDYADDQPPDQDYQYNDNDNDKFPSMDY